MNEGTTLIERAPVAPVVVPQAKETNIKFAKEKPEKNGILSTDKIKDPHKNTSTTDAKQENDQRVEKVLEELKELTDDKPVGKEKLDAEFLKKLEKKHLHADGTTDETTTINTQGKSEKKARKLVVDTVAELLRTLALMLALFKLALSSKMTTNKVSGKDLGLGVESPEGKRDKQIDKALGLPENSWAVVVKETEAIEETTFSDLMGRALAINSKTTPYKIEIDEEEKAEKQPKKNGITKFGKVKRWMKRAMRAITSRRK